LFGNSDEKKSRTSYFHISIEDLSRDSYTFHSRISTWKNKFSKNSFKI